ncbi:hypothetical protein BIFPSEUDO_04320 [Bifidobacterium pseudocatenulatum DSM 20438 = JCM 1200 = LMG 10505]|uniref:Uncharacterized protein n=1 Tax=Bifidobacterium pseudocatenulatum DSM 20438 = JCM 1200 = LMG 10505 TaxID=547043 RepID=C0BV77_BIFPS|nr:hypothetical protein BIFPSEUDO_04320 [Bifidobacterium pseudocatenulatum DSM 20438 = JCM 1200 = LMG 10505]
MPYCCFHAIFRAIETHFRTVNMRDSCSAAPLFDLLTSRFRFSPPFFKS